MTAVALLHASSGGSWYAVDRRGNVMLVATGGKTPPEHLNGLPIYTSLKDWRERER